MKGAFVALVAVLCLVTVPPASTQDDYLPFIGLSNPVFLPESDDGTSDAITVGIPAGFPFWDTVQTQVWVGTNGLLSFGSSYNFWLNQDFPGNGAINTRYLVAPYWDDVDIRSGNGQIYYQTFLSGTELDLVNQFLQSQTTYTEFLGSWMMVAFWDAVHPYFGQSNPEENTFQAVLITDGVTSFTVFTYNCSLIAWDNGVTIGFSAAGQRYNNSDLSGFDLACINGNVSDWSNVIHRLSMTPDIPTEPAQETYLDFIEITTPDATLESCDDCTQRIDFTEAFPFGQYYHTYAYINGSGVISMRREFPYSTPSEFPTSDPQIYWLYAIAPFWSNADLRQEGSVSWKIFSSSDNETAQVNSFISTNQNYSFTATWMLVAHWDSIHPYPQATDRYSQKTNSFQAILITNGMKSYAVFTYKCSSMAWAVQPTIGFNAGGTLYYNHPLTGENYAFNIGCVHTGESNDTNNVVYDLVPNPGELMNVSSVPPYHDTIGSCAAANYTECCTTGSCLGEPQQCYCDVQCRDVGDCCYDQQDICPLDLLTEDYLIVAERQSIDHIAYNGSGHEQLRVLFNGDAVGIDFHYEGNYMFWSDANADAIYRAALDGTGGLYTVADSFLSAVDDIAVDWVANNVYWIDAVWARVEVADIDGRYRRELFRTGANTNPRGIAVDPTTRYMFWTDWGMNPKIERAYMDGSGRQTVIGDNLLQPNGITIDYESLKIYWCDSGFDLIEYANLDGTGRMVLSQDVDGAFSLTVGGTLIFWTDTVTETAYATHKIHGNSSDLGSFAVVYDNFQHTPAGIEAVSSSRQASAINPCESSGCEELCLLSPNSTGYACFPADTVIPTPPDAGSCADAGYSECCTHGYCAGIPATCFCDEGCYDRGDCCMDTSTTCVAVPPLTPTQVVISSVTDTSTTITWVIPAILYTPEDYYVEYGLDNTMPDQRSDTLTSGSNTSKVDQAYTITLQNLHPAYTYFFVVTAENTVSPTSTEVFMFSTLEAAPSGPPQNFTTTVSDNTVLTISWAPPADDMQNGVITAYRLVCMAGDEYTFSVSVNSPQSISLGVFVAMVNYSCSISAATAIGSGPPATSNIIVPEPVGTATYLPFIPLQYLDSPDRVQLPESDDGTSNSIPLGTSGLPFGTSIQTTAFVGTNGLLSFGNSYNSFSNQQFSPSDSRYLVAPFWDDVDIRGGNGDIYYQTYNNDSDDSKFFLDQVNAYLKTVRPTDFEATWMMVAFWDGVHPYFGASNPEENTYQAIVATDGVFTYAIFTYNCGLMEWDRGATIGFSAAGNPFFNNDPSSSDVACANSPDSDWSNIVYLLSDENPEVPPPTNITISDLTNASATVTWTVRYITEQQQYTVEYGLSADSLNLSTGPLSSGMDTSILNQTYSISLEDLERATTYYVRVVSTFGIYTIYSDTVIFTTTERAPTGPPRNFTGTVESLSINFTWLSPAGDLLINSYILSCNVNGQPEFEIQLNPIESLVLYELIPSTSYSCSILATTSGGVGPSSPTVDFTIGVASPSDVYLPFIQLNTIYGVNQVVAPEADEGITGPILIGPGFPFGTSTQTQFYVSTNGLLSFDSSYGSFSNQPFPGSSTINFRYLVAPFWDDADTRGGSGVISYEIHTTGYYLDEVNTFLQRKRPSAFVGTWMAVVYYDAIHPYFGAFNPEENTFQAILVTDGTYSYTIFTYKCGLMEWDRGATIGYSAAGDPYENNDPSTSAVACLNSPLSNWTNVVFRLSESSPELEPPSVGSINITLDSATIVFEIPRIVAQETYTIEYGVDSGNLNQTSMSMQSPDNTTAVNQTYSITLQGLEVATIYYFRVTAVFNEVSRRYSEVSVFRTYENEQTYYLQFLPHIDTNIDMGTLAPCDDCSSLEITLTPEFPFGGYFHQSAYVSTNGLISFGRSFSGSEPALFPTSSSDTFWRYLVAPFWADFNTTFGGIISYEIHNSSFSSDLLNNVSQLIQMEYRDVDFNGDWMLVGYWEDLNSPFSEEIVNTFQAILVTNGSKSYAVFTYHCGDLLWLDPATIGFNAPPIYSDNHPISGTDLFPDTIACVHMESEWNNVIYDLEPSPLILPTTPEPFTRIGSCRAAGFTTCCTSFCLSSDCFCDTSCRIFDDCCYDFEDICPDTTVTDEDILVANGNYIYKVHFQGDNSEVLRYNESEQSTGIDFHYANSYIFWSDVAAGAIYRANMDGTGAEIIASDNIYIVDDIAVDWVSNKLYWVDAVWARIEVMDLDTLNRTQILRTGPNTSPRAIAVEPINRFMFWTDWGQLAKIERSFMDGSDRRTIITSDLSQPNGITIDYVSERIYWTDSDLDKIEYANYDGTVRMSVETANTGLLYPFAVTVSDDILFWSDWASGSIYATHKDHGADSDQGFFNSIAHFPASIPYGIEALKANRQPSANNSCEVNNCSHICLMTGDTEQGYTCACPEGYGLESDNFECKVVEGSGSGDTPPPEGSCIDGGYNDTCCEHGYCAGYPATCYCDVLCYDRGDCCSDIDLICDRVRPTGATDVSAVSITGSSAVILWTIPYIELTSELYTVIYGIRPDALDQSSNQIPSYADTTLTNQTYSTTLNGLQPLTTYYYQIRSQNTEAFSTTEILQFTTTEGPPSGPPLNFDILVDITSLTCSWDLPAEDDRNGVIVSFTLRCSSGGETFIDLTLNPTVYEITVDLYKRSATYSCTVAASTAVGMGPSTTAVSVTTDDMFAAVIVHPFIPLGATLNSNVVYLPESDDGTSDAIVPAIAFPFGSSNRTAIYVGTNGLLSFDTAYNSWFNQQFPGSSTINFRYLVAPFWDDVDIRGGNGQVYYEVHQSGHFLNQVNSYIKTIKPSTFEGTWMLVTYWDAVHPYFGASNPEENTFQAILITDGTYTYTVFTYFCDLLEWGNSPTVGYNAVDDGFDNYDPSLVADIDCLNAPLISNWSNVVYRLSAENPEFAPPVDVVVSEITLDSAQVTWRVPSLTEQQTYYVRYGTSPAALTLTSETIMSLTTQTDQVYSVALTGLDDATVYYLQVVATFGDITIFSTVESFRTLEQPPDGPPLNFSVSVVGVSLRFSWDEPAGDRLIQSYTLTCSVDDVEAFRIILKPVLEIAIEELEQTTIYTCTIFATTSGGNGPVSDPLTAPTDSRTSQDLYLPFIPLGVTYGVDQAFLPESDDGTEGPLPIDPGFPFGDSVQTEFYIGTNGLLSFGSSYNSFFNQQFPIGDRYLVAPFWDDADIRGGNGIISYEIHESGYFLDLVNNFLQRMRPSDFVGTWMGVVYWDAVHPYFGAFSPEENTFQAILITDGNYTYTIFIYQCGLMEWDNGATIGFNAGGDPYANNNPSTSAVACLNSPNSNYSNVVFLLSNENPEIPLPQDVIVSTIVLTSAIVSWRIPSFIVQEQYYVQYGTDPLNLDQTTNPISSPSDTSVVNQTYLTTLMGLEPATIYYFRVAAVFNEIFIRYSETAVFRTKEQEQLLYLPFLEPADTSIYSGTLEACDDCTSSEIVLPADFPFGGYYHQTAYVASNGLISFGRPVTSSSSEPFPTDTADIYWSYIAAPFWSDVDTTANGSVSWEIYSAAESSSLVTQVTNLIRIQQNDNTFTGTWMLVATWQDVVSPSLTTGNTFQAILITSGLKSYAVFTYQCGYLDWSSPATIGINAPPDYYYNHPLIGTEISPDEIACVHISSVWNNVIIDMEPNPVILPVTPEPSSFIGSCVAAGYTDCCVFDFSLADFCFVTDCYCDVSCITFGDCCYDFTDICQDPTSPEYDLLIGNGNNIFLVHYEGATSNSVRFNSSETVQGVDFHYNNSMIFWSHTEGYTSSIYQASIIGGTEELLVDNNLLVVADIAVDWIANNLYWVDSAWARIEVLDLDTMYRAEILRSGANTNPTAIAVDSVSRFMFWTDFGQTAQIERAFLDGSDRRVLHNTGLSQPVGITLDYTTQRVYWSDVALDRIEFSNFDGSGRAIVESKATGLYHPFALTVADDLLFWTDWETNSAYSTHKEHGFDNTLGYFATVASFSSTPYGIEAVLDSRQVQVNNSCEMANCSHICLLTGITEQGFACACPEGYRLEPDGLLCKVIEGSGATPPAAGSCGLAGYTTCCTNGYCAGNPATCFCSPDCVELGSCCSDFDTICVPAPPGQPINLNAVNVNRTTADLTWVTPRFVYGTEIYVVQYGLSAISLDQVTDQVFSGLDTSLMDQTFSVSLEGLAPNTQYYFRVVAVNILDNTTSDLGMFSTLNIGPPRNFDISVAGTESLTFSWNAPYEPEGILSYTLSCDPTFQNEIIIVVPTEGSITLHDFIPGTTYTCSVNATNVNGHGLSATQTATTLEGEDYLPFLVLGSTPGVERVYLPTEDDAASGPIDVIGGLPTGDTVHTRAYVGTNGIISLDQRLLFWDAAQFPTSDYYIINSYMFAPFWSDVDISGMGSISYETYRRGSSDGEDAILDRVSGFIATQSSSSFSGFWMMVAQWDRVHPFPHGYNAAGLSQDYTEFLQSENTFQTIIITNGVMSYAVYIYKCDLMGWSGYNTYATIGYNLNGDYKNHFLSGLSSAKDIACLSSPTSNWYNVLYAVDTSNVSNTQMQRSACITQTIEDQDIFGALDNVVNGLESCPCSLGQAQVDPRFIFYSSSDTAECYVQLLPYRTSAQSCCYSTVDPTNGALLTNSQDGGSMLLYSPILYPNETQAFDMVLRQKCCGEAGLCELFFERRPADNCAYYQPLTWAWGFGDPHFRNLDGTMFTFNGQGEYTLVNVDESGFVLQGRTEPVTSDTNQATRFTTFAFGLPSENIVIEVNEQRGRLIVLLNQEDISSSLQSESLIQDKVAIISPDFNSVSASFSVNGYTHAISIALDPDVNYLSYAINIANSNTQPSTVTGLLGTPNGDISDDFVYPNGTTLPSGASDQMIHQWGQAWQINADQSLFAYQPDTSTETYSNPDFTPDYKSDIVANAPDMISTYCGGNEECIFDYSVTGSQEIAGSTLMANQNYASLEAQASNPPPTISGMDIFQVNTGIASIYNLTVDGGQVDVVGGLPANSALVEDSDTSGLYYFTWTLWSPTATSVSFIATNSMGDVSLLSPRIEICACANGGICTSDGFLGTQNNAVVLQCECSDAWGGQFCEDDLNGCSQSGCFEGVQCYDVPSPGSGVDCGSCPSGFFPVSQKCADTDECSRQDTNDCQQSCTNTYGSYQCTCSVGYESNPENPTSCVDINECQISTDDCQQVCTNTEGSYTCSCFPGFDIDSDRMTCNVQAGSECPAENPCSDFCLLVGGTPVCSCTRGYELGSDGATCEDIDECSASTPCDQGCTNTMGSFTCSCQAGFDLGDDGRTCNDVDECVESAMSGSSACPEGRICRNTIGSFSCDCPEGTMLNSEGECEAIPVVEPTKVVILPSSTPPPVVTPTSTPTKPPDVGTNTILVTLSGYTVDKFTDEMQQIFRALTADIINDCCTADPDQCMIVKLKRETVNIKADNVVIMDISSNDKGDVQFRMYITTSDDGSTVLDPSSIETCLIDGADRFSEAGFPAITYEIDELTGGGSSGLSGGAVAGIVIVVLFIVVAVGATAAFILFRMRKRGQYQVNSESLLPERLSEMMSSEKKDLSALAMSEEEEGEL